MKKTEFLFGGESEDYDVIKNYITRLERFNKTRKRLFVLKMLISMMVAVILFIGVILILDSFGIRIIPNNQLPLSNKIVFVIGCWGLGICTVSIPGISKFIKKGSLSFSKEEIKTLQMELYVYRDQVFSLLKKIEDAKRFFDDILIDVKKINIEINYEGNDFDQLETLKSRAGQFFKKKKNFQFSFTCDIYSELRILEKAKEEILAQQKINLKFKRILEKKTKTT
jgi:hypothetical protein